MHSLRELEPPVLDDYEVLKDAILEMLSEAGDARVRPVKEGQGLFFCIRRYYSDCEGWSWPLLAVKFSGLLTVMPGWSGMNLKYRQRALHSSTQNNYIDHRYVISEEEGEVTEFWQSIDVKPKVEEPTHDFTETPLELHHANLGRCLLQLHAGSQFELTAGDCALLCDRVFDLMPPKPITSR